MSNTVYRRMGYTSVTVLVLLLIASPIASVQAAVLADSDWNGHLTPRYPRDAASRRYRVNLDPEPFVKALGAGANAAELALLAADFPLWTFQNGPAVQGKLDLLHYDADVDRNLPNPFIVVYRSAAPPLPPPAGSVWQWIQIVITNDPVKAAVDNGWDGFYTDPQPNDDPPGPWFDMPFYFTEAERIQYSAGGPNCPAACDIVFRDRPWRYLKEAPVDWTAHLYLVYWDRNNPGTVTICDGIEWGFQIRWICNETGTNVSGGVAGDKWTTETYGIHANDTTYPRYTPEKCIGGALIPTDKLGLIAPYVILGSIVPAITAVCVERVKQRGMRNIRQKGIARRRDAMPSLFRILSS